MTQERVIPMHPTPLSPSLTLVDQTAELRDILSWSRPHGSSIERTFIERYVDSIGKLYGYVVEVDAFGNRWVVVPPASDASPSLPNVLWSCHVDTMGAKGEQQGIKWADGHTLALAKPKPGRCLGADDGAGLWLLREMIRDGIPGTYVFHRGEERGRLGSLYVVEHEPYRLKGFDACVAFDRRGTRDIITHQMSERGCSGAFANSLADAINSFSPSLLAYEPDPTGSYTDSYSYFRHIPECTNVSIGYDHEHGPRETLNAQHCVLLRSALCNIDLSSLVIERDPLVIEYDDDGFGLWGPYGTGCMASYSYPSRSSRPPYSLEDLCKEYPETAAAMLEALGLDEDDFLQELDTPPSQYLAGRTRG